MKRETSPGTNWRVFIQLNRGLISKGGFTLLEVLFALLISAIFLVLALRFLIDQWRGASSLKNRLEAHYAVMTAGKTVTDEIRRAQSVEWAYDSGVLKILPMPPDNYQPSPRLDKDYDKYYIGDLDHDGIKDLYWVHLEVAEPLASFMTRLECTEVEPGLWEVYLEANVNGQAAAWHSIILQRASSSTSAQSTGQPVMSAFLS